MLLGLPAVGIGFTDGVAWSHTVSAGNRFTAYEMTLDPEDPTSYMMDGESIPMSSKDITIEVLGEDGATTEETRTYWSTEFGPVLDFPGVGWSDTATVSYRDANLGNDRLLAQYIQMARAQSIEELQEAHRDNQGIPLFNTIAVDADGTAWYADTSATPNLSVEAQQAYSERLEAGGLTALAKEAGAVLLQGDTSRDRWVEAPDAPWPGVLPYDDLPSIEREDYVLNANDSYWLSNADETIDGDFSILQGEAGTERSVRTLENLAVVSDTSADGPSGDDGLFDLDELTAAALLDAAYTETQWRDGVVDRCRAATASVAHPEILKEDGSVYVAAGSVDLTEACDVLEAWDGHYNVDSAGAVLWREFTQAVDYDELWGEVFDEANPAVTPAGLGPAPDGGEDPVLIGLAGAVALLSEAGVALDVPLGEVQYDGRSPDERLPVPGGLGSEGVTNVVDGASRSSTEEQLPEPPEPLTEDSTLTSDGYPITYGTSFLMAVAYGPDGPDARTILTYGQVGDPELPGYTSGVLAFAEKQWKTIETDQVALAEDPDATVTEVSA
jgi:acyl-homoserine-lactone acylase